MNRFFSNLGMKLRRFMAGRHGSDELNLAISFVALILMLISCIPQVRFLYLAALALLIYTLFRSFSRNLSARNKERAWFLTRKTKVTQWFRLQKNRIRDRKTHLYLKCPGCKTVVRLKKPEKGKTIRVNCPRCGQSFTHKT